MKLFPKMIFRLQISKIIFQAIFSGRIKIFLLSLTAQLLQKNMTRFKNQNGFAEIEIVLVLMIIAILSGVALPKISKTLDIARLDYETKRFISEFYFAKSFSRSSKFEPSIFSYSVYGGKNVIFTVASRSYTVKIGDTPVHEKYTLPKKFQIKKDDVPTDLIFSDGKLSKHVSGSLTIISPQGNSRKIIFDSVDRIHSERKFD